MKRLITVYLTTILVLGFSSVILAEKPIVSTDPHLLLKQKIDLDVKVSSLDNVLKLIAEKQKGLDIVIDPELKKSGIDLSQRIIDNFKVKQVPLEDVLNLVLGIELGYKIESGKIVVSLRNKIRNAVVSRTHPNPFTGTLSFRKEKTDELIEIIKRHINWTTDSDVAPWKDEGGPATIACGVGQQLIIRQNEHSHEKITNLLKSLKSVLIGQSPAPFQEPKEIILVRTLLQKKIDVNFEYLSLYQVLKQLEITQPDLKFVIDPDIAASGHDITTRVVNFQQNQASIETILKNILGKDLGYKVKPGFILITTREQLMRNLFCAVYSVKTPVNIIDWCQEIKKKVNSDSDLEIAAWSDNANGSALIDFMEINQLKYALIISQTPSGHKRISELVRN